MKFSEKKLKMLQQEIYPGDPSYDFGIRTFMTRGFVEVFGEIAPLICMNALSRIIEMGEREPVDYLQTFTYGGIKFWVTSTKRCSDELHPDDAVTVCLPDED